MTMEAWYLCPYDTRPHPDPRLGIVRVPAITRYIPTVQAGQPAPWEETEVLGNHVLVRVETDAAQHALIAADPDFTFLPETPTYEEREAMKNALRRLGYRGQELAASEGSRTAFFRLLASEVSEITVNARKTAFVVGNRRRPTPASFDRIRGY